MCRSVDAHIVRAFCSYTTLESSAIDFNACVKLPERAAYSRDSRHQTVFSRLDYDKARGGLMLGLNIIVGLYWMKSSCFSIGLKKLYGD